MPASLLAEVRALAAGAGLNLFGLVDRERYDAGQPPERRASRLAADCGTIVVLGSGGRRLWQCYDDWRRSGGAAESIAAFAWRAVERLVQRLGSPQRRACVVDLERPGTLNAQRLGEAAGLGTVSPVSGMLLHPEFGPWLRVRAAVLVAGHPFGAVADASISDRFQPCCSCAAPCLDACPASAHAAGQHDLVRCGGHRHLGGCTAGCGTRQACPVGGEHRDGGDEDAHRFGHDLPALQRSLGLGPWRLVPRFLRNLP